MGKIMNEVVGHFRILFSLLIKAQQDDRISIIMSVVLHKMDFKNQLCIFKKSVTLNKDTSIQLNYHTLYNTCHSRLHQVMGHNDHANTRKQCI